MRKNAHHKATSVASTQLPTNIKCFEHYHMTLSEYALYDIARAWSAKTKKFFFDGPKLANQFQSCSKSNIYNLEKSLSDQSYTDPKTGVVCQGKGWLVLEVDKSRMSNGHWSSRMYRVLSHEEWEQAHPGKCPDLNHEGVLKDPKPVQPEGTVDAVQGKASQSSHRYWPVQPEVMASPATELASPARGNKLVKEKLVKEKLVKEEAGSPPLYSQKNISDDSCFTHFDSKAASSILPVQPEGTVEGKPVQPEGTVLKPVYRHLDGVDDFISSLDPFQKAKAKVWLVARDRKQTETTLEDVNEYVEVEVETCM